MFKQLGTIVFLYVSLLMAPFVSAQEVSSPVSAKISPEYALGTGIRDITRFPDGSLPHNVGTYGYARYTGPIDTTVNRPQDHIKDGVHLPLKSRVMLIRHLPSNTEMIYVMLDLGFVSDNIRKVVLSHIWKDYPDFRSEQLILAATHTHSAPAGFTNYMGYEVATPGYRPDIVENIGQRTYEAIQDAIENIQPVHLRFSERFVPYDIPIAFSRNALDGYNANPEIKEEITPEINYVATDRIWQMIKFDKPDDNQLHSVLNFFGAHPNRMGASVISSDTRGAACDSMEQYLPGNGIAIFAQNAPGDIDGEGFYRHQTDTANYYVHPP
ncbi:MAG: hypothetical protein GY751_25375, partial [Bacteroidetes bacterium]|nr:hypothetical protein [Bacteroidota bacterium]